MIPPAQNSSQLVEPEVSWLTTEAIVAKLQRGSKLALRKLPGLQNHLVVVRMGCPPGIWITEVDAVIDCFVLYVLPVFASAVDGDGWNL
eukprot:12235339-Ditylum_brightwellii.AAC.1